jgi:hypothetical protein
VSMTDEQRRALIPGQWVEVLRDDGRTTHHRVVIAPWRLGHGEEVIGLDGITGGYLLSRVLRLDPPGCRTDVEEIARLRAGLEMLAQVRHVAGSAQAAFRQNLRLVDAVLAGADVRNLEVVEAIAAGKDWRTG